MLSNNDIYGPQGMNADPENYFLSVEQYKKKKCHMNCIKCAAVTFFCFGFNSLSFYLGYNYANNEDSSHSN